MCETFEKAVARSELPTREALSHDEFHESADDNGPENSRPDNAADERAGREVTATDTGSSQKQARADCRERKPGRSFLRGAQITLESSYRRLYSPVPTSMFSDSSSSPEALACS